MPHAHTPDHPAPPATPAPRPTQQSIADLLRAVFTAEKPSGRFKPGQPAVTADGTVLSSSPRDPDFFLGGAEMTPAYREELTRANCHYHAPTENGLTWRDFSRARGYSEEEIAQYGQLLTWLDEAGLSQAEWVHLCGFGPDTEEQIWSSEQTIQTAARVLAGWLPSALTP